MRRKFILISNVRGASLLHSLRKLPISHRYGPLQKWCNFELKAVVKFSKDKVSSKLLRAQQAEWCMKSNNKQSAYQEAIKPTHILRTNLRMRISHRSFIYIYILVLVANVCSLEPVA